jgi:hypothetical protein
MSTIRGCLDLFEKVGFHCLDDMERQLLQQVSFLSLHIAIAIISKSHEIRLGMDQMNPDNSHERKSMLQNLLDSLYQPFVLFYHLFSLFEDGSARMVSMMTEDERVCPSLDFLAFAHNFLGDYCLCGADGTL